MSQTPDKIIYTAVATSTGGRQGRATSSDGVLDVSLTAPKELGGPGTGTNPEQLFAAGSSACFDSALRGSPRAPASRPTVAGDGQCRLGPRGSSYRSASSSR